MAVARSIAFVGGLVAAACASDADAVQPRGRFLGSRANHLGPHSALDFDLLQDLEKAAGKDHRTATENRVGRLEKALQPMFTAMPKMGNGNVDATGVRYLLHRLFVQRHGWSVNGLDTGGEAWNSTSPASVFKHHATDHHSIFEDKLHNGFSVRQVAVFAAALEALVHGESIERLQAVYRVTGMTPSEIISEEEAAEAIRAYMVMYVSSANLTSIQPAGYKAMDRDVYDMYPTFSDTENFAKEVRNRVLEDVSPDERNNWKSNLQVVEEVGERYGRWQDKECRIMKTLLMEKEQSGTGRVFLEDFYGPALNNGSWQFVESVPYLRQLGALDESNPQRPSVIISNYLNAPANCVASSKFYSVCCVDQCQDLLADLEVKVAAPDATPEQIASIVSALASDTVQVPRSLDVGLTEKLSEIASFHGGRVPLHGRLFAQWMHHAYPRECPFPHVSGTTNPVTQEEWIAEQGEATLLIGEADIRAIVQQAKETDSNAQAAVAALPWSSEEELFVGHQGLFEVRKADGNSYASRGFLLVLAPVAAVAALAKYYKPSGKPKGMLKTLGLSDEVTANHKYYV